MRALTLVQDIDCDVDEHWRVFLDDVFDRAQYVEGMGFPRYEALERIETETEVVRRCRLTPRLDALVAKALGPDFAYLDEGTFDKQARVWRSRAIPSRYPDRVTTTSTIRAEPAGARRCRRTVALTVEVRAPGIAGLIEGALARSLRTGWEASARFMNGRLGKAR